MSNNKKFAENQSVTVSGTFTGYGDLTGYVLSVDWCNIAKTYYYHVRTQNERCPTVYAAEKWLQPFDEKAKLEDEIKRLDEEIGYNHVTLSFFDFKGIEQH